jgi:G3E family GTPase
MLPVNMYLIGGFLGAGKTTLLQHILNWDIDLSTTAVLVNEFGQISVDGMLLDSKGSKLIELASGCVCCSMRGQFVKSIEEVLNEFIRRRIFVETTGVGDTLEIIGLLRGSGILDKAVLNKIVCVLDADIWHGRDNFGTVFFNQLKAADLILLNKVDLVDKDRVPLFIEEVRQINPHGMVVPTYHCRIDPDILLEGEEAGPSSRSGEANFLPKAELGQDNDLEFMTLVFQDKSPLSEACFREFIQSIPSHVFRIKGVVRFSGRAFMLNHVAGRTQWSEFEGTEGTRLVIIGWKMDADAVLRDLNACREPIWDSGDTIPICC